MNNWQRVSPIALLYFFFSNVKLLVSNFIYLIPVIFTSYQRVLDNPFYLAIGVIAAVILFALASFLQYYFFKYRLAEQSVEIKSGVLFKKHLHLPFARIQNVRLIAPAYFRPFGYTSVELDTAGSAKNEAKIVALEIALAQQLKQQIVDTEKPQATSDTQETQAPQELLLNQRSLSDLVLHGITNNRVWIFLALLAPFFESIVNHTEKLLGYIDIDLQALFSTQIHAWWQITAYAVGLLLVAYVIVMLFSILGSIIAFYGFTLTKKDKNYIRRSGLLTRHEVVMKESRLQLIIWQQDWLDCLIKRVNLRFEQNNAMLSQQPGAGLHNKLIVPSITPAQSQELIKQVWPQASTKSVVYKPISKRYLLKKMMLLLPIPLVMSIIFWIENQPLNHLFSGGFLILAGLFVTARWLRWGYAIDDEFIYIRNGIFGVNYYVFPIYKVQQTAFRQSWFMRRHGLATIKLILAPGARKIPFISEIDAKQIINQSLHHVEATKKNWM